MATIITRRSIKQFTIPVDPPVLNRSQISLLSSSSLSLPLLCQAAVNFCLTLNKRSNRRRLARALLMVPRTRYDLLPFYARLVAALAPVMPDLVQDVNSMLTGEFQWRVSKRDQLNLESKLKIVRFIGELRKGEQSMRSYLLKELGHHDVFGFFDAIFCVYSLMFVITLIVNL